MKTMGLIISHKNGEQRRAILPEDAARLRYPGQLYFERGYGLSVGTMRTLHGLGARVDVYGRRQEQLFRKKMFDYDVLVNCVMWDTAREDRIIYKEDLKKFRPGTLIIDVSCDPELEIETSRPTTIEDPVYTIDGVIHYAVDNTPGMFPITVTKVLSQGIGKYIDIVLEKDFEDYPENLKKAVVIRDGSIRDERIRAFREKRGVFCK